MRRLGKRSRKITRVKSLQLDLCSQEEKSVRQPGPGDHKHTGEICVNRLNVKLSQRQDSPTVHVCLPANAFVGREDEQELGRISLETL